MNRALFVCLSAAMLGGCGSEKDAENEDRSYATSAELETFCDRLPRAAYAHLDKHPASTGWFEVYEVAPGTWAIYEPHQWQEVISYLVSGTESAVLFDTGNGIARIQPVVADLTDRPIRVVNSHSHYDHVGGNWEFDEVLSIGTPFSRKMSDGLQDDQLAFEVSSEALCTALPAGVTPQNHRVRPYPITATIEDGDVLDLGGRTLEVLHVPGHTDDAVALLERDAGFLWTGDTFYEGPIWLFSPETDLGAYRASVARLAALAPTLTAVFPGHNTPRADPDLLIDLQTSLEQVLAGEIEPFAAGESKVEFPFPGFSFLMREGDYRLDRP